MFEFVTPSIWYLLLCRSRGRLFSIIALEFSLCKILSRKRGKFNSYPQKTILFWLAWANKHWHTLDSYIHSHLLTIHINYSHEGWKQYLLRPFQLQKNLENLTSLNYAKAFNDAYNCRGLLILQELWKKRVAEVDTSDPRDFIARLFLQRCAPRAVLSCYYLQYVLCLFVKNSARKSLGRNSELRSIC